MKIKFNTCTLITDQYYNENTITKYNVKHKYNNFTLNSIF